VNLHALKHVLVLLKYESPNGSHGYDAHALVFSVSGLVSEQKN